MKRLGPWPGLTGALPRHPPLTGSRRPADNFARSRNRVSGCRSRAPVWPFNAKRSGADMQTIPGRPIDSHQARRGCTREPTATSLPSRHG
jgi:hypothetical protein